MSSTNTTTNYSLPQFISTDKPTWLGDFNGAMSTIDTQMKTNNTLAQTAKGVADAAATSADLTATNARVTSLEGSVSTLQTDLVKVRSYHGQVTTNTLAAGTDGQTHTIQLTLPTTYSQILAVIPYGYDPSSSWNTRIVFDAVDNQGTLRLRVVGSTSQYYTIRYWVIYAVS